MAKSTTQNEKDNKNKFKIYMYNFPSSTSHQPFVKYSVETMINNNFELYNEKRMRHLLWGGWSAGRHELHEIVSCSSMMNIDDEEMEHKSFVIDYNKQNAMFNRSLNYCHTFLIKNNSKEYVIYFQYHNGYNAYDMTNDEWISEHSDWDTKNKHCIKYNTVGGARSIMITDNILVISDRLTLFFHLLSDIKAPVLLTKYKIKTKNLDYCFHGMECIKFQRCSTDNSTNERLKFKLLLFGGGYNDNFLESFLQLDIDLTFQNNWKPSMDSQSKNINTEQKNEENNSDDQTVTDNDNRKMNESENENENENENTYQIKVEENLIGKGDFFCRHFDPRKINANKWRSFAYESIVDGNNNVIIVIIGGDNGRYDQRLPQCVCLYNSVTHEITVKYDVRQFYFAFVFNI